MRFRSPHHPVSPTPPGAPRLRVPASSSRTARRGFSFTEILFAVMILGIGFIMVAAMFPVALQQTENSVSETTASSVARSGAGFVAQLAPNTFISMAQPAGNPDQPFSLLTPTIRFPASARTIYKLWQEINAPDTSFSNGFPTPASVPFSWTVPGEVWALDYQSNAPPPDQVKSLNGSPVTGPNQLLHDVVFNMTAQNMIQTANPRMAWVAFYKRDLNENINAAGKMTISFAPSAQVIVVVAQVRNADAFTSADLTPGTGSLSATRYDGVQLIPPNSNGPTPTVIGGITFGVPQGDPTDRSVGGAFVIVAGDTLAPNNLLHGQLNGHILRLGTRIAGPGNTWEFSPGFGLTGGASSGPTPYTGDVQTLVKMNAAGATFSVYMLGMGRDPNSASTPPAFAGPAMDVAAYSSFVSCGSN